MPTKLEEFLELMSRDPIKRTDTEMGLYVTWLRRRVPLLKNLDTKIVIDLIRIGRHLSADKNDVIIKQGQQVEGGDNLRFFIVIRGSTSVYVNPFIVTGPASRKTSLSIEHVLQAATPSSKQHPKSAASKKTVSSKVSRTNPDIPEDDVISDGESEMSFDPETEDSVIDTIARANEETLAGPNVTPATQPSPGSRSRSQIRDRPRTKLGRFIVRYEKGKYFGDEGMVDDDGLFNVSVIANERTDIIVIDKDFFNKHIKDQYEKEEELLANFIADHPFFKRLTPQYKTVLQISLKTVHIEAGSYIVEQGEPINKIIFLSSGSAEVTVNPNKHRYQYPEMWPFETSEDIYYNEFDWLRESRRKVYADKYKVNGEVTLKALNKNNKVTKKKCICIVDRKEVIGIPEVVMDLNTHAQSVRCIENCEVYTLALKTFKKVVKRRSPETMNLMSVYVQDRLRYRMKTLGYDIVPLFKCLDLKISRELVQQSSHSGELTRGTARLKEREEELLQLVKWFKKDKAPLISRSDPETIQYKEDIKVKARDRQMLRHRIQVPEQKFFRSGCTMGIKSKRAPMSIRQLKDPLNELMFRLRLEGTFVTDERELEELIKNCPVTPVPEVMDIRTQTDSVLEQDLHCFRLRQRSRRLISNFARMLELANAHQITDKQRIMSSALFASETPAGTGSVSGQRYETAPGPLWGRFERHDRGFSKTTARSFTSNSYRTIQFERKGATPRTLDMRIHDFYLKHGADPDIVRGLPRLRKYDYDSVPDAMLPLPGGKVFITKSPCVSCNRNIQLKNHLHVRSQMLDDRDVRRAR